MCEQSPHHAINSLKKVRARHAAMWIKSGFNKINHLGRIDPYSQPAYLFEIPNM